MSVKIHTPEIFKLQLSLVPNSGSILVYNRTQSIIHEFEASSLPDLVDYIRRDKTFNGLKTYVWGFIQDGLLVIEKRVAPPGW